MVHPQWLEHQRLIYYGWFELIFQFLENSQKKKQIKKTKTKKQNKKKTTHIQVYFR